MKARSGNNIKILRTDGDGVFGRSKTFQELRDREKFIHERPASYDHQQNALIDRRRSERIAKRETERRERERERVRRRGKTKRKRKRERKKTKRVCMK